MKIKQKKDGFTISEVVLVLAIAGLIFLMVFIAWPALQRSQRDTQRRNDYSMLSTAVSNYITNNNGKLDGLVGSNYNGTTGGLDPKTYVNKDGKDPDGKDYVVTAVKCTSSSCDTADPAANNVRVMINADCSGSANGHSAPKYNSSSRAFAIYGYLESGSKTFCSASQ